MRPVFRLGVGLVGGLALGMALYGLVLAGLSFSVPRLCVCMALMGALCYLGASMLVGKTLRVLPKRLTGAAVTALVLVLLCVVLRADVFGYRTRVPQAEKVYSVRVISSDVDVKLTDPASIRAVAEAQPVLVEHQVASGNGGRMFRVQYNLKNGSAMARCFWLDTTPEAQAATARVVGLEEYQISVMFNGSSPPTDWKPRTGSLYIIGQEERELTAEEAQALYDAAWRDIRAGNALPADGDYAFLSFEIYLSDGKVQYYIGATKSTYRELTQALLDLGVPESDLGEILID